MVWRVKGIGGVPLFGFVYILLAKDVCDVVASVNGLYFEGCY
jgi:hypothetical protein